MRILLFLFVVVAGGFAYMWVQSGPGKEKIRTVFMERCMATGFDGEPMCSCITNFVDENISRIDLVTSGFNPKSQEALVYDTAARGRSACKKIVGEG